MNARKSDGMRLPLEKILTIGAGEWADCEGIDLSDYNPVGVHAHGNPGHFMTTKRFASDYIPNGAVVVVNYRINSYFAYGTALVPKKREEHDNPGD